MLFKVFYSNICTNDDDGKWHTYAWTNFPYNTSLAFLTILPSPMNLAFAVLLLGYVRPMSVLNCLLAIVTDTLQQDSFDCGELAPIFSIFINLN